MTVENLPHWTIRPNWSSPVTERLEWQTAVLQSPSAAEQRFSLRWSPRRSFEFAVQPHGPTRTLFDLAVGRVGVDAWYMPLWHDGSRLGATLATGASSLAIDTANREFRAGSFVMLRENDFTSEVLEIDTLDGGEIGFVDGPERDWPATARIYPALKARLDDQPSMSRLASRTLSGSLRFEVVGENDWIGAEGSLTTYLGFPVLTVPPNEVSDLTHAYERLFDEQDNGVGVAERLHTSDIGLTIQGYNWTALGRQEHAEMRSLLYTLAGRRVPLWLPTFADDLYVVTDIDAADTSIEVARCGFTDFGGPRENRRDIQIVLRDGTRLYRRINGSALTMAGTELLTLAASLGVDVAVSRIKRVSFMALCRQDTDQIEFVHLTDNKGASQIGTTFRSAPNIRSVTDTGDATFVSSTTLTGACGESECTTVTEDLDLDNPYWAFAQNLDGGDGYYANQSSGITVDEMPTDVYGMTYAVTNPAPASARIEVTKTEPTDTLMYPLIFMSGAPIEVVAGLTPYVRFTADISLEVSEACPDFDAYITLNVAFTDGSPPAAPPGSIGSYPSTDRSLIADIGGPRMTPVGIRYEYRSGVLTMLVDPDLVSGFSPAVGVTYEHDTTLPRDAAGTIYVTPFIEYGIAWTFSGTGHVVTLVIDNLRFSASCEG